MRHPGWHPHGASTPHAHGAHQLIRIACNLLLAAAAAGTTAAASATAAAAAPRTSTMAIMHTVEVGANASDALVAVSLASPTLLSIHGGAALAGAAAPPRPEPKSGTVDAGSRGSQLRAAVSPDPGHDFVSNKSQCLVPGANGKPQLRAAAIATAGPCTYDAQPQPRAQPQPHPPNNTTTNMDSQCGFATQNTSTKLGSCPSIDTTGSGAIDTNTTTIQARPIRTPLRLRLTSTMMRYWHEYIDSWFAF